MHVYTLSGGRQQNALHGARRVTVWAQVQIVELQSSFHCTLDVQWQQANLLSVSDQQIAILKESQVRNFVSLLSEASTPSSIQSLERR